MTEMDAERITTGTDSIVTASCFDKGKVPGDLLLLRKNFVEGKGWVVYGPDKPDDRDEYDDNPTTIHVVSRTTEGQPIAALRITPVESAAESLSYGMLRPEIQAEVDETNLLPKGDYAMFDMTRLVVDLDMERRVTIPEIANIIGVAEKQSVLHSGGKSVMWVFAVDGVFAKFLERTEMIVHIIAKDSAGAKTMFGYAFPTEVKEQHIANADKYKPDAVGRIAVRASEGLG